MRRAAKYRCLAAFTLVELLLAMGITALVGLAAAAMLYSSAYGTSTDYDLRELLIKTTMLKVRIADTFSTCREVLMAGNDIAIVWTNDENNDDTKQKNEMVLIRRNTSNDGLYAYADPSDTADYTSAYNFIIQATSSYPSELWATGVTASTFSSTTTPSSTAVVTYYCTITGALLTNTLSGTVAQRVVP